MKALIERRMVMICPICKKEMLYGYIPTIQMIWAPKGKILLLFPRNGDRKKGFRLGKLSWFSYRKHPAYFCKNCEYILIEADSQSFPADSEEM